MAKFKLTGTPSAISWEDFCKGIKENDEKLKSSCPFSDGDKITLVLDANGKTQCHAQSYELDGVDSGKLNYTVLVKNQNGTEFWTTLGLFKSVEAVDASGKIIYLKGALSVKRNESKANECVCKHIESKPQNFVWTVRRQSYSIQGTERVFVGSLVAFVDE